MRTLISNPTAIFLLGRLGGLNFGAASQLVTGGEGFQAPSLTEFTQASPTMRSLFGAEAGLAGMSPDDFMQRIMSLAPGAARRPERG